MSERTLAIIKPDAVERGLAGKIIQRIEAEGFTIRAMRKLQLSKPQAEGFYAVHAARPFFGSLTDFMSSGPCILLALPAQPVVDGIQDVGAHHGDLVDDEIGAVGDVIGELRIEPAVGAAAADTGTKIERLMGANTRAALPWTIFRSSSPRVRSSRCSVRTARARRRRST